MNKNIFNQIIDHLYRAPIDEGAWQQAFEILALALPCLGWEYFTLDISNDMTFSCCSLSLRKIEYPALRHWLTHDLPAMLPNLRGGQAIRHFDIPATSGAHCAIVCLAPCEDTNRSVLVWVHDWQISPAEEVTQAWLTRLLPHLERIGRLHAEMLRLRRDAALREGMLNKLGYPLLLIDKHGRIRFSNQAANHWQADNDAFCFRSGRLTGRSKDSQAVLDQLLQRSLSRCHYSIRGFPCRDGGRPSQIIVVPLTDTMETTGASPCALFLVTIGDLQSNGSLTIENVRALFGFTGAEARVTIGLAEGKTLEEIAQAGSVSINTVRSQLRQAMEKTGTCRQTELIRTITALPRLDLGIDTRPGDVTDNNK